MSIENMSLVSLENQLTHLLWLIRQSKTTSKINPQVKKVRKRTQSPTPWHVPRLRTVLKITSVWMRSVCMVVRVLCLWRSLPQVCSRISITVIIHARTRVTHNNATLDCDVHSNTTTRLWRKLEHHSNTNTKQVQTHRARVHRIVLKVSSAWTSSVKSSNYLNLVRVLLEIVVTCKRVPEKRVYPRRIKVHARKHQIVVCLSYVIETNSV